MTEVLKVLPEVTLFHYTDRPLAGKLYLFCLFSFLSLSIYLSLSLWNLVDQVQVIMFLILWLFSVLSSGFITDALGYQTLLKENGTVLNVKIK